MIPVGKLGCCHLMWPLTSASDLFLQVCHPRSGETLDLIEQSSITMTDTTTLLPRKEFTEPLSEQRTPWQQNFRTDLPF